MNSPLPSDESRSDADLIRRVREMPLVYGPWRDFKSLYKAQESAAQNGTADFDVLAATMGRLDTLPARSPNPRQPALSGRYTSLHLRGTLLYALDGSAGSLQIIDVSEIGQPRVVGFLTVAGQHLAVAGRYAVAGGGEGLSIIDVSDPQRPLMAGSIDLAYPNAIAADGDLVAVIHYDRTWQVKLFDISNLANPVRRGQMKTNHPREIVLRGGLTLVQSHQEVTVFDVSNPDQPIEKGRLAMGSQSSAAFAGERLCVVDSHYYWGQQKRQPHGLHVLDVAPRDAGLLTRLKTAFAPLQEIGFLKFNSAQHIAATAERAFVAESSGTLSTVDISNPAQPQLVSKRRVSGVRAMAADDERLIVATTRGLLFFWRSPHSVLHLQGPSARTRDYMKRRARRLLRRTARQDAGAYVQLAYQTLLEANAGRDNLDRTAQMLSDDILFGGLLYRKRPTFVLKRRFERAPAAWDDRLDLAQALWTQPHLPPAVAEAALKILLANKAETPLPDSESLARHVRGESPLLRALSTRWLAQSMVQGHAIDGATAAAAFFRAGARTRRALWPEIENRAGSAAWRSDFAAQMARELSAGGGELTRRRLRAARVLADHFAAALNGELLLPLLPILLGSDDETLFQLGLSAARTMPASAFPNVLWSARALPDAARDKVIAILLEAAAHLPFDIATAQALVNDGEDRDRHSGWQLLMASASPPALFDELWLRLLRGATLRYDYTARTYSVQESAGLLFALRSEAALQTLERVSFDESVLPWWATQPRSNSAWYSGDLFGALALILKPDTVLRLIGEAPAVVWNDWRKALSRTLQNHLRRWSALWLAALARPEDDAGRRRLAGDVEIAALFERAIGELPFDALAPFVLGAPDDIWANWRPLFLARLGGSSGETVEFWRAAWPILRQDAARAARFTHDDAIAATFAAVPDNVFAEFLPTGDTQFEPLLLLWLERHRAGIERDNPLLLAVATHLLPGVREWGLGRLDEIELDVPLALRLMEVAFPQCVAAGQRFFQSLPRGDEREEDWALALCDSPQRDVRAWGLGFITERALIAPRLLARLSENFHPDVQAWLAARLLEDGAEIPSARFDRAVLRARNQGRRAKELVKSRLDEPAAPASQKASQSQLDTATLLELARSRTPRDAEWALRQIALRGLNGETMADVEVGGAVEI